MSFRGDNEELRRGHRSLKGQGIPLDALARERRAEEETERERRVRAYRRYHTKNGRLGDDFLAALVAGQELLDAGVPEEATAPLMCCRCGNHAATEGRADELCPHCRGVVAKRFARQCEAQEPQEVPGC